MISGLKFIFESNFSQYLRRILPDPRNFWNVVAPTEQGRQGHREGRDPDKDEGDDGRREGGGADVHQVVLLMSDNDLIGTHIR